MSKNKPIEWDPNESEYWVNQKVTLPPIGVIREEFDENCPKKAWKELNTHPCIVLITHVEVEVDDTAQNAYYGYITKSGYESNMNFDLFPIEMALKFGIAGHDYFGGEIPLVNHPHFDYE